nr:hypothetical protein GCM10020241_43430 [Streptoalloteichus tenebrarius]
MVSALDGAGTERRRDDHMRARSSNRGQWAVLSTHAGDTGKINTTGAAACGAQRPRGQPCGGGRAGSRGGHPAPDDG